MKKGIFAKILTLILSFCMLVSVGAACGNVKFDVKFMVDGEVYTTVSTKGSGVIQMPENPEKEDYTFEGWFWDEGIWQVPFTANSLLNVPLTADMAVYAKFTKGQITGVTFEDVETTYDGTQKLIAVSGLPEGATVTYDKPNAYTNAGEYVVTATVKLADHEDLQLTAKLTIKKAVYDMSGVSFNGKTVTYDGQPQSIEINGNLPDSVSVSYDGNGKTEVGEYTVTAKFVGDSMNYELIPNMTANLVVLDKAFDGLRFEDKTVTYNGGAHTIEVIGVPNGATVSYDKNTYTNAGEYTVTATISRPNYKSVTLTATLVISKANYDMSAITFADKEVTYNGKTHSLAISGTLPNGVTVSYENNGKTNAGVYSVIAKFVGDSVNYNAIANMDATLVISKANYDMSGITFADKETTYNGKTHSLAISGTLPDGVTVSYENNGQIDADVYNVTAKFAGDSANYNAISNMYATLTINKATYDMSNVAFNDKTVEYNGQSHSIYVEGFLPNGVEVEYAGNDQIEVGEYTVTAYFRGDENNYERIPQMKATLLIKERNYKELYSQYDVLGKTMNLITAEDFKLASGAKSIFTDEIYYRAITRVDELDWNVFSTSSSDYTDVVEELSTKLNAKVSLESRSYKNKLGNTRFLSNKGIDFGINVGANYEKKVQEQTSTYFYSFKQNIAGYTAEISGYNSIMNDPTGFISQDFIEDAKKVRSGELSAENFIKIWGTHVVMAANYGAAIEVTYSEISHDTFDSSKFEAEINAAIGKRLANKDLAMSLDGQYQNYGFTNSQNKVSQFSVKGYGGGQFVGGTSLSSFYDNYPDWAKSIENKYVWYDVPDGSLMCVWYFLDDSFDDVKEILDEYVYAVCENQYKIALNKVNNIYKDDVLYNKETKTLTINLSAYQESSSAAGFVSSNYSDKVFTVMPGYQGNPIERIVINGKYKLDDANLNPIEKTINDFVLFFDGTWTKDIVIELNNVGLVAPSGKVCLDLSKVTTNVEIILSGENYLKGGDGADGSSSGSSGADGKEGIIANNLTISGDGALTVVGGNGGNGVAGSNGKNYNDTASNEKSGATGGKGTSGGNGGNGATAINVGDIIVKSGTITLQGGNGGKGANGGNGGKGQQGGDHGAWGGYGGNGGNGGNAGNGGNSDNATSIIVMSGNVILIGGNAGLAGSGGSGGAGGRGGWQTAVWPFEYYAGTGGKGGDGGNGGQAGIAGNANRLDLEINQNTTSTVIVTVGKESTVGKYGTGGSGGSAGTNDGYAKPGDKGPSGADGAGGTTISELRDVNASEIISPKIVIS